MYLLVFLSLNFYIYYMIFLRFLQVFPCGGTILHKNNTGDCKASKDDRKGAMDEARSIVFTNTVAAIDAPKNSCDNIENDGTFTHLS